MKKDIKSNIEYVLQVKAISNSLLDIGGSIIEQDHIDFIVDGLLEEYNLFVMKMHGNIKPLTLFDVQVFSMCRKRNLINSRRNWLYLMYLR